jgi:NarL family two-component system response regulator LiaR
MTEASIRVLVVDDQAIVRKGIRALIEQVGGIEVVGEAGAGQEAIEATRRITAEGEGARILVLTSFAGDDKVFPAIKAGALGYLLKDSEPEDLLEAIQQVHRGEPSLSPTIAQKVLLELRQPSDRPPTPDPLTDREVEVIQLVAKGLSNRDIAERLVVTEATVRAHVSNILSKLHLANRVQAALYALQEGLASLEDGPVA